MAWYKKLNFEENPLDARPNPDLVSLEEEEEQLKNHILKEELCFLNGLTGSGKTSLLLKIQNEMKGHKFIYLDAQDLPKYFNLEEELRKKRSFFDKIVLRKFPRKTPVLIIDEFQATDPRLILEARGKWEKEDKKIKSIVIAQISQHLKNVSDSFKDRLGSRMVVLKNLDEEDMKKILEMRLYNKKTRMDYIKKLSEDAVNLIIRCADGNARRLLEYTDIIFDFHHRRFKEINPMSRNDYFISYYAAKEILEVNGVNVAGFTAEEKPVKRPTVLEKRFSFAQQRVLRFLLEFDRMTADKMARKLRLPLSSVRKTTAALKKKNALLVAGRKRRKELLAVAPSVRRLMTEE